MGSNTNIVTVVIPLYNKVRHIKRALDSVVKQTYRNLKVIVVNDGSTDGSEKVVEQYTDPRIRLINQTNAGVSAARNRGIRESRTELIAFLDADDEWISDFLETVVALYNRFPGAVIWATGFTTVRVNGETKNPPGNFSSIEASGEMHLINIFKSDPYYKFFWTSSIMASKRALQTVGGFPEYYRISQDTYAWNRLAFSNQVAYCPAIKAIYHMDADNHAFANHDYIYTGVDPVVTAFFDYMASRKTYTKIPKDIRKHISRYCVKSLLHNATCSDRIAISDMLKICLKLDTLHFLAPICFLVHIFCSLPELIKLIFYNACRLLLFRKPKILRSKSHYIDSAIGQSIFNLNSFSRIMDGFYGKIKDGSY